MLLHCLFVCCAFRVPFFRCCWTCSVVCEMFPNVPNPAVSSTGVSPSAVFYSACVLCHIVQLCNLMSVKRCMIPVAVGIFSGVATAYSWPWRFPCMGSDDSAERRWWPPKVLASTPKSLFTTQYKPFKLGQVINLSSEVAIFRFLTPNITDEFNLPVCSTLQALAKHGSAQVEQVQRLYTPITENHTQGYFDIIVRKYYGGRMTEHLFSMDIGESLLFRCVQYKLAYRANRWTHLGLIGGGTGITPLLQVIRASVHDPRDKTQLSLLFGNRTERKVLLKGMLDKLSAASDGRFKAFYAVDRVEGSEPWHGFIGPLNTSMMKATMPPPSPGMMILVCGPDRMMSYLCGTPLSTLRTMSGGLALQPAMATLANVAQLGWAVEGHGLYGRSCVPVLRVYLLFMCLSCVYLVSTYYTAIV